ncbi:MAG: hypothetical protein JNL60_05305 [Bacteroidia bacterium]|nr:hypothetical protein [Bacteroidia bacterium]
MKTLRVVSIVMLLLLAINALAAGYSLMSDPSGEALGMSPELLRFSSFKNFFIPGLVLFTVNGVFALVTALVIIKRWPFFPFWIFCQGLLLTGWILIQVLLLRQFNFLHAIMGTTGVFFITAGFLFLKKSSKPIE